MNRRIGEKLKNNAVIVYAINYSEEIQQCLYTTENETNLTN